MRDIEAALTARYGASNRIMSYFVRFDHRRAMMSSADIASIENMLNTITGAEQINVLLHSPGGDPTVIEKMIHMCRMHMSGTQPKLRVIVPNVAKSAATLFALGADTILMGYCSELGPIDPQVPISVSGVTQWVSAFAFVGSRDKLMEQLAEAVKKKEPTAGYLTQLASLNIPFTHEMENWIEFSRKTGATLLNKYMLKPKFPKAAQRQKKADSIAEKLLSKQLFPVHPQFINGETARNLGLEVELLGKDEPLWDLL
jgi:Serine dehydrogenase proteinase